MNENDEPTITETLLSSGVRGVRVSENGLVLAIDFESMAAPGTALRVGIPAGGLGPLVALLAALEKQLASGASPRKH